MKIYIASSWKNDITFIVEFLRNLNHTVYDFREAGFKWDSIDTNWENWTVEQYLEALSSEQAGKHYKNDMDALSSADLVIMMSPSGLSSSFELGFALGSKKHCVVYLSKNSRPELMFKECHFVTNLQQLQFYLDTLEK